MDISPLEMLLGEMLLGHQYVELVHGVLHFGYNAKLK